MNYSTIKKAALALSLVAAVGYADVANAQEPAKVFGGRSQYRTWSIGINAGALTPSVILGGYNDQSKPEVSLGYGANIRKQFSPHFSVQADFLKGTIKGSNEESPNNENASYGNTFETDLNWQTGLTGNYHFGAIDFLRRENVVGFYLSAGYNLANYEVTSSTAGGSVDGESRTEQVIPVGAGVKFKLGSVVNLDLGYKMNFLDADNLDNNYDTNPHALDKYSYGYAGLEFNLGSKSKPTLEWNNPVANLYDELKDPALRNEVEALKQRVTTLEGTVAELGKDTDGDGVADKFDKCPNTPAGTVVDGSGCPIKFPEPVASASVGDYAPIQFEFDSYVLKTSSYPTLDKVSQDLRNSNGSINVEGYASAEGSDAYNLQLSKDRANAVKNYLVNSGVAASNVNAVGHGEANPVASNATEAGRIQNRRVEFTK
ncbi:OmpA family protein [Albibacterium sp.]|uniref:OmpA family protein n=1 Tax=Albibacterium sp. TaxID=2952885 RepID=UPI002CFC5614|nr:OmpA family protein [Albibacterium sp.]HUH19912.1 OmpA family protein [Albibacterium sp.]